MAPPAPTARGAAARKPKGAKAARETKTPIAPTSTRLIDALRAATRGEYEIQSELGRGGMATVFLARDLALDRNVAIKVMSPTLLDGQGSLERFQREARTAASLSHPHIIAIHAVRQVGDLLFFVMKYVEGRSLDAVVRRHGPLPVPTVVQILFEVAGALAYAHRRGIVHRDVKPANIMIDNDGWAIVTDFGIAKVAQEQGITLTGTTVGTPAYMSPEQCLARDVGGASDQYSLGIVAYELLTGRVPFHADSLMEMLLAQTNNRPPALQELRPDLPPRLAEIVTRMIAKAPEDRWPSLEDVVAALAPLHQADSRERTRSSLVALARGEAPTPVEIPTPDGATAPAPRRTSERAAATARGLEPSRPRGHMPWWILPAILIPIIAGLVLVAEMR